MKSLSGLWPEVQFIVDVVTFHGLSQDVCSVVDVPFFGQFDETTGDVCVLCLWSLEELTEILAAVQQWGPGIQVLNPVDEQLEFVNGRLNLLLKDDPWNWIHQPPPSNT